MDASRTARWDQYNDAGRRAFSQGHLEEAEDAFRSAVREGEQLGAESPQLASSLNAVGQIRFQIRDYATAEPLLTRGLAIREKVFGSDGHGLVPSLNTLAALYDAQGDFERAETLLRRSLAISERHVGLSHPEISAALSNLAKLCFKRREFAKADRLLLRLLEIKRALGKEHPEVATVLSSLAKLRQVVGKHEQAEQLWRQTLAIRERSFAPNDPVLATTLEGIADCCAQVPGRLTEAVALRERAMTIRERATTPSAQMIGTARAKLEELRVRARSDTALPPEPPPRRSSKELPSPLTSAELPTSLRDEARRLRHSDEVPWIQLDGPGQLPAQFDTVVPRSRTPSASVTPMGVPKQGVPAPLHGFAPPPLAPPPIAPTGELVLMDSILPEPPTMKGSSGRSGRYVPPEPRKGPSSRGPRYVAPDLDSTAGESRRRAPRVPSSMARRGSSKRLVLFGAVLILLAAAAWAARGRLGASPAPLGARTEQSRTSTPKRLPTVPSAQAKTIARPGGTPAPIVMATTDSTRRTTRSEDARLQLKSVPAVGDASDIDVVTSNVEQSTKSKVESAQRPRIDTKPLFKKP